MHHHRLVKRFGYILLCLVVFGVIIFFLSHKTYKTKVVLGGQTFSMEVADTQYLLQKGLSGHTPLGSNEGMVFIFKNPDKYGFWMKDMTFPIDIIWVGSNFRITHIENSLQPSTYPKIFYPSSNSLYVLEVSAGKAQKLNVNVGDLVKFVKN